MPISSPRFQLALRVGAALAVMLALGGTVRWLALDYERSKSAGGSPSLAAIGELDWQTLVPKGWDPLQRYRNLPLASLDDGSLVYH